MAEVARSDAMADVPHIIVAYYSPNLALDDDVDDGI